jgi:antitoxin (DNA-binding transcriptional repressor) of toxin-antitoxin stability system
MAASADGICREQDRLRREGVRVLIRIGLRAHLHGPGDHVPALVELSDGGEPVPDLHVVVPGLRVGLDRGARVPEALRVVPFGELQVPQLRDRHGEVLVAAAAGVLVDATRLGRPAAGVVVVAEQQHDPGPPRLLGQDAVRELGDPRVVRLCVEELPRELPVARRRALLGLGGAPAAGRATATPAVGNARAVRAVRVVGVDEVLDRMRVVGPGCAR